jgi:hypothetical protein
MKRLNSLSLNVLDSGVSYAERTKANPLEAKGR